MTDLQTLKTVLRKVGVEPTPEILSALKEVDVEAIRKLVQSIGADSFQTLMNKALSDEKFARALVEDPKTALRKIGIEPTPQILSVLESIDIHGMFVQDIYD